MTGILIFLESMSFAICAMCSIAIFACILYYVERHETKFSFMSERYAFERNRSKRIIATGIACMVMLCIGAGLNGIGNYRKIVNSKAGPVEPNAVRAFNECLEYTRLEINECRARAEIIAQLTPTCFAENHKKTVINTKEVAKQ